MSENKNIHVKELGYLEELYNLEDLEDLDEYWYDEDENENEDEYVIKRVKAKAKQTLPPQIPPVKLVRLVRRLGG